MSQIRSFIALELPPLLKGKIEALQTALTSPAIDVRWVRPEGIHLTLKFLGAVGEEKIPEISHLIVQCASAISPFNLAVGSLGAFPNEHNPKVIWVGAHDASGNVSALQQSLEKKLATIGFKEETRPFSPHLTLGRVRSPKGKKELAEKLAQHKNHECGTCKAREIVLFKSDLTPGGALYTKLHTFSLHQ